MINREINFWDTYPELKMAPGLDKLYKEDKSKGKEESSQLMWAIDLCENLDSKYYRNPDKYSLIAKTVLKDPKFKWKSYQKIIEFYRECCLTQAERSLTSWNETMKLRDASVKEMYAKAIEEDDTDKLLKLDRMLTATPKMYDDYGKIREEYNNEQLTKKGEKKQSMSDSDDI